MTEKIYVGFDCCKDYKTPTRTPRIYPRNITLPLDGTVELHLRTVHPDCYDSCYTWKILKGGGYLEPEVGIKVYYHAPHWQEDCLESPLIEARCPRQSLDKIRIGVTGTQKPIPAVLVAGQWEQPEFALAEIYPHLVGMKYCDKDPKVQYWTLRIDEYDCNGKRLHRHQIGVLSQLIEAFCGIKIYTERFRQLRLHAGNLIIYGYAIWRPLETAKSDTIRLFVQDRVATITGMMWKKFRIANAGWPKGKSFLLTPGGILDVRMDKVIEMECCPLQLIEEE